MLRTPRTRPHALLLAGALLATGCLGDLFQLPAAPAPAAPPGGRVAGLWELAPADAVQGSVIHDGALARALALWADPDRSPARTALEELAQERGKLPFNPLSPEGWAGAGLDPHKGAAAFRFADKKRGALFVLPVTDRALFRRAFKLLTREIDGHELEALNEETVCEPAGGRYLCAHKLETILAAAAPHASPLAKSAAELEEHGEIEMLVSRDAPDLTHFNHGPDSAGWVTAVTGAFHLREDGATLHLRASGSLATPRARAFYGAPPRPDLAAAARGAPSVGRLHLDPAALVSPLSDPEVRSELLEQLTGDVEALPSGVGFANGTILLPLHDAPRVEAFVKKRCAESAAVKERRALDGFTVSHHGCAAVFDATKLTVPVLIPQVPIALTVADGRLVVTIGDAGKGPPGARSGADAVEGAAAQRALEDAETLLFFGHNLGLGPEVGAGALVRAAIPIPLVGDQVATAVEAWDYVSAHVSQALVRAQVTDEVADFTVELTGFAGDPAPAQAAYRAALARRWAGDEPGYRAALAALEKSAPGTRVARRAAEVRAGAPFFGAGAALLGALAALNDAGRPKPRRPTP